MTTANDPPSAQPDGRRGRLRHAQPHSGHPQPDPPHRPPAPTALFAAAVIQIVQSALWLVLGVVVSGSPGMLRDAGITGWDPETVAFELGSILVAVAVVMIVLALRTIRGRNRSRIASIVLETIFGVVWMLYAASSLNDVENPLFPLLALASCVAVVTLLLTASARAATARR